MDDISLGVPESILESLPEDDGGVERDMRRAVEDYEDHLNRLVDDADDEGTAADAVLDVVEHFEARAERFDDLVPELRAWGQSPVYAIAWRNLYADLVTQLDEYDWLADQLDRDPNVSLVADRVQRSDG